MYWSPLMQMATWLVFRRMSPGYMSPSLTGGDIDVNIVCVTFAN